MTEEDTCFPVLYWGLEPLYWAYYKMYICDILSLEEIPAYPGVHHYRTHTVLNADVMGIVMGVKEKQQLFQYFIDDGTGVLTCTCWKPKDATGGATSHIFGADIGDDLASKLRELECCQETATTGYQLGELVHMRGKIRTFMGRKELSTFCHRRVTNPVEEVHRMNELPDLYSRYYDLPPKLPPKVTSGPGDTAQPNQDYFFPRVQTAVVQYINERRLPTVKKEAIFQWECVKDLVDEDKVREDCVTHVLQVLERQGYLMTGKGSLHYMVVPHSMDLEKKVLGFLKSECQKPGYETEGCHYMHILDKLKQSLDFAGLNKNGLLQCLNKLEGQSDIISTTSTHYIAFDV